MFNGLEDILKTFFEFRNPVYLTIFLIVGLFLFLFLVYRFLITPVYDKFKKEKESLELQSAKLTALFAELDPDPVLRIDPSGIIIETNYAARQVFKSKNLNGTNIKDLLPIKNYMPALFQNSRTQVLTQKINDRHYSILIRGNKEPKIAQIYFRDITEMVRYEDQLLNYQTKLRDLSEHLQDLIEVERKNIARGLHDGIGQTLSMMRIRLLKIMEGISKEEPNFNNYKDILAFLDSIIRELKEISYSLMPRTLEEMGLGMALKQLVDKVSTELGISGEINAFGDELRMNSKMEISIFRIVQEAVNNIAKYSKADSFSVQLMISKSILRLIISDNGIGFDADRILSTKESSSGMGLINIRERVRNFDGQFKIETAPGKGTVLVIIIPIDQGKVWT